jgi:hypothetical protein
MGVEDYIARGVRPLDSPVDVISKITALQTARQQQALTEQARQENELKLQQVRDNMAADKVWQEAFARNMQSSANGDQLAAMQQTLAQTAGKVPGAYWQARQKAAIDYAKDAIGNAKSQAETDKLEQEHWGNWAIGIQQAGYSPEAIASMLDTEARTRPQYAAHARQLAGMLGGMDSAGVKQTIDGIALGSEAGRNLAQVQTAQRQADIAQGRLTEEQNKNAAEAQTKAVQQARSILSSIPDGPNQQAAYETMLGRLPHGVVKEGKFPDQYDRDAILKGGMTPNEIAVSEKDRNQGDAYWIKVATDPNSTPAEKTQAAAALKLSTAQKIAGRPVTNIDMGAVQPSSVDPASGSILAQTGLSAPAFAFLTGNNAGMPRDRAIKAKAIAEAQAWANKNGIDISTIQSQYKGYNQTLTEGIHRLTATQVMEDELKGTIANMRQAVKDEGLGQVKWANVAKLWLGGQVNDPQAARVNMHLNQLRSEIAAYNGATQGRTAGSLTVDDSKHADKVINDGLGAGSLEGLLRAVEDSTAKMTPIMQRSIDRSTRGIWDLFGVGKNYKNKAPAADAPPASGRYQQGSDPANLGKF